MSYSSKAIMSPFIKFLLEEVQSFEGNIYDTKRGGSFAYNEACRREKSFSKKSIL
jgi:hypothetical protein